MIAPRLVQTLNVKILTFRVDALSSLKVLPTSLLQALLYLLCEMPI